MSDDLNDVILKGSFYKDPDAMGMYISAIYRHMQIIVSDGLQQYRIGHGQLSFFFAIATVDGISQKKLSEELFIDKTTTAKAVRRLEEEGYVRREHDPADKRYHRLFLTETGKKILPEIEEILGDITRPSRFGINDKELEIMMIALHKVLDNVTEQVGEVRKKRLEVRKKHLADEIE